MSPDERPEPLGILGGYFAADRIAHECVFDLHGELVQLDAADHSRALLRESAAVALERMPELARRLHGTERKWA